MINVVPWSIIFFRSRKFLIEFLMEEVKLVVAEKNEFENRNKSKKSAVLKYLYFQQSYASIKLNECLLESSFRSLEISIETLIEKIRTVVAGNRVRSARLIKIIRTFPSFRTINLLMSGSKLIVPY